MLITAARDTDVRDQPSGLLKRVQEMLGLHKVRSDQDLVALVEERLSTNVIGNLRRTGLTDEEIYSLVIPRRTLTHRRARREALSRDESDRAVRIVRIAALGERVFDDRERFWRWLRIAKRQFGGRSPLQLVATEAGARLVEELLYRIDEGMAA
jgi:putative toxin-antitoxin system antitoxin component (TIGR02293 family)